MTKESLIPINTTDTDLIEGMSQAVWYSNGGHGGMQWGDVSQQLKKIIRTQQRAALEYLRAQNTQPAQTNQDDVRNLLAVHYYKFHPFGHLYNLDGSLK